MREISTVFVRALGLACATFAVSILSAPAFANPTDSNANRTPSTRGPAIPQIVIFEGRINIAGYGWDKTKCADILVSAKDPKQIPQGVVTTYNTIVSHVAEGPPGMGFLKPGAWCTYVMTVPVSASWFAAAACTTGPGHCPEVVAGGGGTPTKLFGAPFAKPGDHYKVDFTLTGSSLH